jgi:CsoR family transcriptional regulator, copper-sensing transcriptional repressor
MEEAARKQILRRLQSIEGHIRGIERMVDEETYCIETMKQINAVQAALAKVNQMILESHLNTCVTSAVRGDDPQERERVLREIADVFEMAGKV